MYSCFAVKGIWLRRVLYAPYVRRDVLRGREKEGFECSLFRDEF